MTQTPDDLPELAVRLRDARQAFEAVLAERWTALESEVGESVRQIRDRERRGLAEDLNRIARRLQQASSRGERLSTLLEAAAQFGSRSAVFEISDGRLRHTAGSDGEAPEVPLGDAPAFASAVESKDLVVAAGTPGELSQSVCDLLGAQGDKAYLFPVISRRRTEAVLYLEPGPGHVDINAVELLASLAGPWLEEEAPPEPKPANLISIAAAQPQRAKRTRPEWTELSPEEQEVHLRAQRFARTRVAELLLHRSRQVEAGRSSGDLYRELRGEIDAGRDYFRNQFAGACRSMVDYYHLELVRTLAKDDETLLGPEYPGPVR